MFLEICFIVCRITINPKLITFLNKFAFFICCCCYCCCCCFCYFGVAAHEGWHRPQWIKNITAVTLYFFLFFLKLFLSFSTISMMLLMMKKKEIFPRVWKSINSRLQFVHKMIFFIFTFRIHLILENLSRDDFRIFFFVALILMFNAFKLKEIKVILYIHIEIILLLLSSSLFKWNVNRKKKFTITQKLYYALFLFCVAYSICVKSSLS